MNSGTDVLGKFYEVFLKYGNGAKEIGIVLTPRHITKFAVDVIDIGPDDIVYDPTCGTAGFLVAAFDHVKSIATESQVNRFKTQNLYGVEQDAEIVALAIVNMIFRGDGKNKIVEGSCFQKNIAEVDRETNYTKHPAAADSRVVTRVLMNPPFALKTSDEKEFKFVDHAPGQMRWGGILFAILPYPMMVRPGVYKHWREHSLIKSNTLLSVMTFNRELFYPADIYPVAIFVKSGEPHPSGQNVLWLRALNNGLLKHKKKRLPNVRAKNDLIPIRNNLKAFLANPSHDVPSVDRFQAACPIDMTDPLLELVPENYLTDAPMTDSAVQQGVEKVMRDAISLLVGGGSYK